MHLRVYGRSFATNVEIIVSIKSKNSGKNGWK